MQMPLSRLLLWLGALAAAFSAAALAHDPTALPLGDGKLANAPRKGWIWACHVDPQAGGAFRDGPWINQARGTYDITAKAVVPGNVSWPYNFKMSLQQGTRVFTTNDFPSHGTGTFPISAGSDAYRYDRNPNSIAAQNMSLQLPANPGMAPAPACAPGAVGILLSGAVLFNALDAPGRDAVAHETQDRCQGHPQVSGVYHYHSVSPCVDTRREADGHSALVGYALDGFGIYGRYGENGRELASADLDECHGHTHTILWDGKPLAMYHYHATQDFPYTVGCMRGRYRMSDVMTISGPPPTQRTGGGGMGPGGGQGFGGGPPNGPRDGGPGGRPNLEMAAGKLGISAEQLRAALGPPPPDLQAAARQLGISEDRLRQALESSR